MLLFGRKNKQPVDMEAHFNKLAKTLVTPVAAPKEFGKRPDGGCSMSQLEPCNAPIKTVYGSSDKYFLFDESLQIPLVTKLWYNMAEGSGAHLLGIPSETEVYKKHATVVDINKLLECVRPEIAKILRLEALLDELQFDDKVNMRLAFGEIAEEDLADIIMKSQQISSYLTFNERRAFFVKCGKAADQ